MNLAEANLSCLLNKVFEDGENKRMFTVKDVEEIAKQYAEECCRKQRKMCADYLIHEYDKLTIYSPTTRVNKVSARMKTLAPLATEEK